MRCQYAVTFEFATRPPVTARGVIVGGRAATCVARATRAAQEALRPIGWTSMLCVLLERVETAESEDEADEAASEEA
jgi:hypothetical protein